MDLLKFEHLICHTMVRETDAKNFFQSAQPIILQDKNFRSQNAVNLREVEWNRPFMMRKRFFASHSSLKIQHAASMHFSS